jgi:hypothetical protein
MMMLLGVVLCLAELGEDVKQAPAGGEERGWAVPKVRGEQAAARRSRRRSQSGRSGVNIASLVLLLIIIYCAFNRSQKKVLLPDEQPFIKERGRKKGAGAGSNHDDADHSVL